MTNKQKMKDTYAILEIDKLISETKIIKSYIHWRSYRPTWAMAPPWSIQIFRHMYGITEI